VQLEKWLTAQTRGVGGKPHLRDAADYLDQADNSSRDLLAEVCLSLTELFELFESSESFQLSALSALSELSESIGSIESIESSESGAGFGG
jgi:hypothetical protein